MQSELKIHSKLETTIRFYPTCVSYVGSANQLCDSKTSSSWCRPGLASPAVTFSSIPRPKLPTQPSLASSDGESECGVRQRTRLNHIHKFSQVHR